MANRAFSTSTEEAVDLIITRYDSSQLRDVHFTLSGGGALMVASQNCLVLGLLEYIRKQRNLHCFGGEMGRRRVSRQRDNSLEICFGQSSAYLFSQKRIRL
jgi:hypothetical protein